MSPRTPRPSLAAPLIVLVLLTLLLGGVLPAFSAQPAPTLAPGAELQVFSNSERLPHMIVVADPNPLAEPQITLPPAQTEGIQQAQTATFLVEYTGGWPDAARAAFDYALSLERWGSWVTSAVPIRIEASWAADRPNVLGGASPGWMLLNPPGGLPSTWYFVALANKLAGTDLCPLGGTCPVSADIKATFNSAFPYWYFGTDGAPGAGQYDFVSVVLHEIAHGLGFAGSMFVENDVNDIIYCSDYGLGCWGLGTDFPIIYDRFAYNGSNQSLLNEALFPNDSVQLASQLTSNNLYFSGSQAVAAYGNRPPLYAPSAWQRGSSYSHLSDIFNGTANAMMTYSLNPQEVNHYPGTVALAMLADMGWTTNLNLPTATPTRTLTPTATRTPAPLFTPTPRNTPSVWRRLPMVVHNFAPKFTITGSVRYQGAPVSAIPLTLHRVSSTGDTEQVASTFTDATGGYRFSSPPPLAAGQSYLVQYRNNSLDAKYLWIWYSPRIWSSALGTVTLAPFDIGDVVLSSPADSAAVPLPATFKWQPRSAVISDSYEFDLYEPNDFIPWFWSEALGYKGEFTLTNLPRDSVTGEPFVAGVPYVWEVWIYAPDGGYGVSLAFHEVTFEGTARQSLDLTPAELQQLVERWRLERLELRP